MPSSKVRSNNADARNVLSERPPNSSFSKSSVLMTLTHSPRNRTRPYQDRCVRQSVFQENRVARLFLAVNSPQEAFTKLSVVNVCAGATGSDITDFCRHKRRASAFEKC